MIDRCLASYMKSKKKKTKLDEVTTTLRQRILGDDLKVDDLLPTENMLADEFGCSRGTIGKALDRLVQQGLVTRKTRVGTRVVSQSPKALVPSLNAFGFVHPSEQHEQIWEAIRGFSEAAEEAGRRTVAISYNNDQEREFDILQHLGDFMLEGAAIYPVVQSPAMAVKLIEASERSSIPTVFVHLATGGIERPMVIIDGFDAGMSVTTKLIDKGAKNIGFLGNNGWTLVGRDFLQGYRRALQQAGLDWQDELVRLDYPTRANFTEPTQEGYENGGAFLKEHPELDAVVCTDGFLGHGFLHAARKLGRNVPDDFLIGVLDHNSHCELPDAAFISYRVDHRKVGRQAFETLDSISQINNGDPESSRLREIFMRGELLGA